MLKSPIASLKSLKGTFFEHTHCLYIHITPYRPLRCTLRLQNSLFQNTSRLYVPVMLLRHLSCVGYHTVTFTTTIPYNTHLTATFRAQAVASCFFASYLSQSQMSPFPGLHHLLFHNSFCGFSKRHSHRLSDSQRPISVLGAMWSNIAGASIPRCWDDLQQVYTASARSLMQILNFRSASCSTVMYCSPCRLLVDVGDAIAVVKLPSTFH